ncbi:MAG: hypothetical protein Q8T11_08370 [Elusimicrobiota bacterium]|nr:hypothetical protein [Elusimicrobiota bacterium]
MLALGLFLLLSGPVFAADDGPDEATRVKIVEYMLKTPLDEANPTLVSGFMKLDTAALPKKLRDKARAKQLEIDAVVKIHKGKKKGPFRYPAACQTKIYEGPEGMRVMKMIMGNAEITTEEEEYLELKGNCTEEQLMCEFSLNIVIMRPKGQPPIKHYFLMEADPLMAWVAEKRGGGASAGNRYFEEMKPSCQQSFGSP